MAVTVGRATDRRRLLSTGSSVVHRLGLPSSPAAAGLPTFAGVTTRLRRLHQPSTSDDTVHRLRAVLADRRAGHQLSFSDLGGSRERPPDDREEWPGLRSWRTGGVVGSSAVEGPRLTGAASADPPAAPWPALDPDAAVDGGAAADAAPSSVLDRADTTPGRDGSAGTAPPLWWRRLAERWTPEGLRGARVDPGRRGAAALITAVVIAALVVAGLVWRARPEVEPVPPPPAVLASSSTSDRVAPGAPLVVAVTGRVRKPGVVQVPAGARVIDALRAAGGPLPGVDLALLNLARKLADGELVVVGLPGPADSGAQGGAGAGSVSPSGAPGQQLDLNSATVAQLDTLPGVGPVLAQRILDWRTKSGPFTSVDQLAEVPGIGESRLAQLRDLVRV